MKKYFLALAAVMAALVACPKAGGEDSPANPALEIIKLPAPVASGDYSLEELLVARRSVRSFTDTPLTLAEIGQLCWAAQGITNERGFRTAPSAGALYPLELYCVTADGVCHYLSRDHALEVLSRDNVIAPLADAAVGQACVSGAPCVFVFSAVYARTSAKYGDRAERYVHMEVGHAAQNLLLEAVALGLGGVPVGAFYDERVAEILGLPEDHAPLMLLPAGHPR